MFPYVSLQLNEEVSLVMPGTRTETLRLRGLGVYEGKGAGRSIVEVNKPLSMGGWKIYQLSYDETKGKWSRLSIFELVK